MERCYEQIVIKQKDDETREDLFKKVAAQLQILLEEKYIAVVRYDEPGLGIIVIEFEHDNNLDDWGNALPMWVTHEEAENIAFTRRIGS